MKPLIRHLVEQKRFECTVDGNVAYVEYIERCGTFDIVHTYVPKAVSGRGIASALVAAAYEYADSNNLAKRGSCPYAALWLERNTK
ncbi:MAG: N-acetyltransferase [Bacteroidales bacterium]|nr:N-acetyltransferase [Bacteroidales bacterium]MDE5956161.1 N-acetyltransferase [Bacteroidales bacterium]MDE6148397.1 N-acetyltransferase [Bacteroidales bacterium]